MTMAWDVVKVETPLKVDFGCGTQKKEGFVGADSIAFPGVDVIINLGIDPWPWKNDSVTEGYAAHFVEHLTGWERVHFYNELWRVMQVGAKCTVIVPHWASCRAYGDPTHQWPPVSEFSFYYLSREWRKTQAPHTDGVNVKGGYSCHFECTWGYSLREDLVIRNQEYQTFAATNYKEACQDMMVTITKLA